MDELKPGIQVDIEREKLKRAVKEALDEKAVKDLGAQNLEIISQLKDGFAGVHARQDIANGRTGKLEERVVLIETKDYYNKVVWYLLTVAMMAAVAFGSYILYN